ncbi:polyprenyl synthetase family protein [Bifidobacterium xylocopae]|uniref:Serralysin n=1 Tax=Bifidobacterium xylocopae TaxID=2493119 RepID=A0A366KDU4_9BIFI|nr:polyprenyl synthetase family protein [Bifidobacterium xylocopae]RBP99557.1 serralysin [Bifidobacterium xylocopae]
MAREQFANSLEQRMEGLVTRDLKDWAGRQTELPDRALTLVRAQAIRSGRDGKRLRARLLVDTYQACRVEARNAEQDKAVLDLASAIEIFQTSALVHDDLIDQADLRRGHPSAHRALERDWAELTERRANPVHQGQTGLSLALLLGDLLAASAVRTVDTAADTLPHPAAIRRAFVDMVGQVNQGQVMDLAMESMELDDPEALRRAAMGAIEAKTASYTTIAPIQLGMLAAGRDPGPSAELSHRLGSGLGAAFQLADDLIDATATPLSSGKAAGGDVREGKRTVLLADSLELSNPADRARLITVYLSPERDEGQVALVLRIFRESGAVGRSRRRINDLRLRNRNTLDELRTQLSLDQEQVAIMKRACARFLT